MSCVIPLAGCYGYSLKRLFPNQITRTPVLSHLKCPNDDRRIPSDNKKSSRLCRGCAIEPWVHSHDITVHKNTYKELLFSMLMLCINLAATVRVLEDDESLALSNFLSLCPSLSSSCGLNSCSAVSWLHCNLGAQPHRRSWWTSPHGPRTLLPRRRTTDQCLALWWVFLSPPPVLLSLSVF